jgi:hypothetical protein
LAGDDDYDDDDDAGDDDDDDAANYGNHYNDDDDAANYNDNDNDGSGSGEGEGEGGGYNYNDDDDDAAYNDDDHSSPTPQHYNDDDDDAAYNDDDNGDYGSGSGSGEGDDRYFDYNDDDDDAAYNDDDNGDYDSGSGSGEGSEQPAEQPNEQPTDSNYNYNGDDDAANDDDDYSDDVFGNDEDSNANYNDDDNDDYGSGSGSGEGSDDYDDDDYGSGSGEGSGAEVLSGTMNIQGFDTVASFTASHQDAFKASLVTTLSSSIPGLGVEQIALSISLDGRRRLASGSGVTVGFTITGISSSELSSTTSTIEAIGTDSTSFLETLTNAMVAESATVPSGMAVVAPTSAPTPAPAPTEHPTGMGCDAAALATHGASCDNHSCLEATTQAPVGKARHAIICATENDAPCARFAACMRTALHQSGCHNAPDDHPVKKYLQTIASWCGPASYDKLFALHVTCSNLEATCD